MAAWTATPQEQPHRDDALVGFLTIEEVEDGFDDMRNTSGTTTAKTIS